MGSNDNDDWRKFTFSPPNIIHNSERSIDFQLTPDHLISQQIPTSDEFQFSPPTNLVKVTNVACATKQYKPRISRNTFKAPVDAFTQALKGTPAYEQFRKYAKSQQQKSNIESSLTCTLVPKLLLDKTVAREHFATFGDISKIIIRPKKQTIIVSYVTKGEADIAYHKCGTFLNEEFNVQWTSEISKSTIKKIDSNTSTVSSILKGQDDTFREELEALKHLEYNLHEETHNVMKLTCTPKLKTMKKETKHDKASSRLEKLTTAKVEKIGVYMPKATIEELQSIIRQPALTSEDKHKILEARDRLMRLKHAKSINLATAQVTRGTCPDMCPEKERLMRETQRQVSFYEQLDNKGLKINHMTAIKQYSRSSADQEEPMPHELRPVSSLKMTMSYLLHEIVNLCEKKDTNLAEWYHFLWDRMRGIRKDITQQELCCLDSVGLVEQCARFHILCSERLCTEDSNVFDKKINTENLTKCLQTLKYMYHDLMLKGIFCKNEPEFRAYIILLNLNNGSFMWDLQKLPSSIQKSSEVKFAIEVYSSVVANNYVKFFKLLRKTTYLNASILLRYFNQVRITALSVMVKAYCRTISKPYPYPLYELIDILAFEEEREAIYFCEQVGLSVSQDELYVLLNKENFSPSENTIEQTRSFNLIESKRHSNYLSVGQCIAGGTLSQQLYKNHQPHDSFDSQGYLLEESFKAKDQKSLSLKKKDPYEFSDDSENLRCEYTPEITIKHHNKVTSPICINNRKFDFITFTNSKLNDTPIDKSETGTKMVNFSTQLLKSAQKPFISMNLSESNSPFPVFMTRNSDPSSAFENIVNNEIFSGLSANVPSFQSKQLLTVKTESPTHSAIVTVKKQLNEALFKKKEENEQTRFENSIQSNMCEKISQNEDEVRKRNERQEKLKEIQIESEQIYSSLQSEIVDDICSFVVKNEMQIMYKVLSEDIFENMLEDILQDVCKEIRKEEIFIQKSLCEIRKKRKRRISDKYCKLWKGHVSKRKIRRKALDDTPIWLQKQSLEDCAKSLYCKQQDAVVENMCKKRLKLSLNHLQRSNDVPIEDVVYVGIKENIKPFDNEIRPNMFWKMAVSWPYLENRVVLHQRKNIINKYLNGNGDVVDSILKIFQPNAYETLHVCIRSFEGVTDEENLTGMDALLFIASTSEDSKTIIRRLTKTVLSKNKLMPIPLVVVLFHDGNIKPETIDITTDLENLIDSGFISEYTIVLENTVDENVIIKLMQSAVLWLAVNKSPQVPLEMDYLKNVLRDCLMEELWFRIEGHSAYNKQLESALGDPQFVINLHKEAITHLLEIILDQESLMYTDFSPELKRICKQNFDLPCSYEHFNDNWKNIEYRVTVEKFVKQLIVPQWRNPWPIHDKVHLLKAIRRFCLEAMADYIQEISISDILNSLIVMIDTSPFINFPDILLFITNKKIDLIKENFKVVYNRNHIKHFRTLPWWFKSYVFMNYDSEPFMNRKKENEITEKDSRNVSVTSVNLSDIDDLIMMDNHMDQSLVMNNIHPFKEISKGVQSQMSKVYNKLETFGIQLEDQKRKNQHLENEIRKALFYDKLKAEK